MNRFVIPSAVVAMLLLAAPSLSATPLELVFKCGDGTWNATGRADRIAFVPAPETVDGADYTPRVMLRPGSEAWQLLARWEFSQVEPATPPKPAVYLLDGRVVEPEAYQQSTEEIEYITFSCSDAAHESLGIEPGHTLVVAFTYPVLDLLRKEMTDIETLQADFMKANGRFARSVEELGWKPANDVWVMELTAAGDGSGWSAVGRHVLLDDRESMTVSGSR